MGLERRQHYLKANKNTEFPYHFIFFDTETMQNHISDTDIEHVLSFGVALYWRRADSRTKELKEWFTFQTPSEFWKFVSSKCATKRRIIIVSHNLPFDMGIVQGWNYLEQQSFKPTKIILDYQCNIWKFRKGTVTLMFLDNMNFFQTSLAVLGDSIGLPKLDMPKGVLSIEVAEEYCRRDVEILYKAWYTWFDFLNTNDLGSFGYTIASQALNAFRHRFMPVSIGIHTSTTAIAIERGSYRGGRNECFRLGEYHGETFYMLDVNSMYPFVMIANDYPHNLLSTGTHLSLDKATELVKDCSLVALCDIDTNEPCYGVKVGDKLLFPTGQFQAALTTKEITRALGKGHITGINAFALYSKASLFNDYVAFFYDSRLRFEYLNNPAYAYLCKIMLNSLYGKFGQRIEEWKFVCNDPERLYDWWQEYDYSKKKLFTYRCINHRVEASTGHKEGYNSLVAISSEITANARLYLWNLITVAGIPNVYYCDTDSLIVTAKGYKNLGGYIDQTTLGMVKLVDTTNRISIHNLKDYSFGGKVKIKGISKDAEMIAYNTYKQYQSLGIKTGLHHKDINRVIWREVTKVLRRDYTKGEVLPDGRVIPLVLSQYTTKPERPLVYGLDRP